jgi:hypothetical protein
LRFFLSFLFFVIIINIIIISTIIIACEWHSFSMESLFFALCVKRVLHLFA